MGQYVHVRTRHVGPMAATSKEEKPTAPLMPAVQPATLVAAGPGRAAGRAAGRPICGSAAGQQAGRSVMFCPRCWRVVGVHTVHSARRWCCIISIQISAPGIVYYTYFYLLFIMRVIKKHEGERGPEGNGAAVCVGLGSALCQVV